MKSKIYAWSAFAVVIVILVITFTLRTVWWAYSDIFFAFMMVFCHLIAVNISGLNPYASRKLDKAALVFAALMVVALAVEFILFNIKA